MLITVIRYLAQFFADASALGDLRPLTLPTLLPFSVDLYAEDKCEHDEQEGP